MAPQKSDEVRAALEKVWLNSRLEAMGRVATLQRFAESLGSGTPDQMSWQNALSAAHRLSGSLGMFGFNEASSCAAEIEGLLGDGPAPDVATTVRLVEHLQMLLEGAQASSGKPERRDS
ncbi:MAG TPA: Hpt domain-containing protein [Terriglobales bacterium]|nr:Hpt domain-containing protein [Terriglobales bacterium]